MTIDICHHNILLSNLFLRHNNYKILSYDNITQLELPLNIINNPNTIYSYIITYKEKE